MEGGEASSELVNNNNDDDDNDDDERCNNEASAACHHVTTSQHCTFLVFRKSSSGRWRKKGLPCWGGSSSGHCFTQLANAARGIAHEHAKIAKE
jgi:hypothetical protein